jgi:hypothetical protein
MQELYLLRVPSSIMVGKMHEFVDEVRLIQVTSNGAKFFVC